MFLSAYSHYVHQSPAALSIVQQPLTSCEDFFQPQDFLPSTESCHSHGEPFSKVLYLPKIVSTPGGLSHICLASSGIPKSQALGGNQRKVCTRAEPR